MQSLSIPVYRGCNKLHDLSPQYTKKKRNLGELEVKGNVYLKLIGFGVGLTLLISVFSALAVISNAGDNSIIGFQILAFLISTIFLTLYMKKKDSTLKKFGFEKRAIPKFYYVFAGVIILVQPLVLGIDVSLSISTTFLIIIQMILVGYTEEALFRGVFFYFLQNKGPAVFILFSSIVFGVLHIASGLNPNTEPILVVLQIVNALLLGAVFSFLYYVTRTIYLVIVFHALFNIFASITLEVSFEKNLFAVLLLSVLYIIFLVFLIIIGNRYKEKKDSKHY